MQAMWGKLDTGSCRWVGVNGVQVGVMLGRRKPNMFNFEQSLVESQKTDTMVTRSASSGNIILTSSVW